MGAAAAGMMTAALPSYLQGESLSPSTPWCPTPERYTKTRGTFRPTDSDVIPAWGRERSADSEKPLIFVEDQRL